MVWDFEPTLTPTSKDQCKNGGWQTFNTPKFKNQGECIKFVSNKNESNNDNNDDDNNDDNGHNK